VACVDWPGSSTADCLSHVSTSDAAASVGFQLAVVIPKVRGALPVFLMYMTWFAVPPGGMAPQLIDDNGVVHALSE